jgi:hypothetical protein
VSGCMFSNPFEPPQLVQTAAQGPWGGPSYSYCDARIECVPVSIVIQSDKRPSAVGESEGPRSETRAGPAFCRTRLLQPNTFGSCS